MIARADTAAVAGPTRTCVGCRKRDRQAALVRLVADGDRVVVDADRRRPGRGAWVHPDRKCAARVALGAIERGLKRKLAPAAMTGLAEAIVLADRGASPPDRDQVQLPSALPAGPQAGSDSRQGNG